MDNKTGVTDRRKEAPMDHTINFNEMNLYVRYVQYIEGDVNYYLPWRILYDNFLFFVDSGSITLSFEDQDIEFRENELCIIPPFLKNRLKITPGQHCWYYGVHFDFFYDDSESFNEDVYIPENLGLVKADLIEMPVDKKLGLCRCVFHRRMRFRRRGRLFESIWQPAGKQDRGHGLWPGRRDAFGGSFRKRRERPGCRQ